MRDYTERPMLKMDDHVHAANKRNDGVLLDS